MRRSFQLILIILVYIGYPKYSNAQFDTARITIAGGIYDDECRQVIEHRSTGFVAVGTTGSFGLGNTDVYVIRTDSNLLCQWSETIGGSGVDRGYSITETFDGGLAIAGFTNGYGASGYDVLLIKTDSVGTVQWIKTYGGADWDFGYSLKQTADSGFVICGESYSYSNGDADVLVVKTDKSGNLTWIKNVGGPLKETGYAVVVSRNGNYVVAGKTLSFGHGNSDAYVVALNPIGDTLWTKTYGDDGNNAAYGLDTTMDNGFIFVGVTDSSGIGDTDGYVVKLDNLGNQQWHQVLGGSGDGVSNGIVQRWNGGYIVAGTDNSFGSGGYGFTITRTDGGGYQQAGPTFGGVADEEGYSVAISRSMCAVFGGTTTSYGHGLKDIYLLKLPSDSIVQEYTLDIHICNDTPVVAGMKELLPGSFKTTVYPNPFHDWVEIVVSPSHNGRYNYSFEVYDLMGQLVASRLNITQDRFRFYRGELKGGIYYLSIFEDGVRIATKKLLVD